MNLYWTILFAGFAILAIAGETYALKTNRTTMSRYIWNASKRFPPLPLFVGLVAGFLFCHFWWGGIVYFEPVSITGGTAVPRPVTP